MAIAVKFGTHLKVVQTAMRRLGVPVRPVETRRRSNRDQSYQWKGDSASYDAFHLRVYKERGKPKSCEVCGCHDKKYYDWANLTGNYSNVNDYKRMCRSCHRKYDISRRPADEVREEMSAKSRKIDTEKIIRIRELRSSGVLLSDIASLFGISDGTVSGICRRMGIYANK